MHTRHTHRKTFLRLFSLHITHAAEDLCAFFAPIPLVPSSVVATTEKYRFAAWLHFGGPERCLAAMAKDDARIGSVYVPFLV